MEVDKPPTNHGGAGRKQGDRKQHVKDVSDESQYPRLFSYFTKARAHLPSEDEDPNANKRSRSNATASDSSCKRSCSNAAAIEPPDVAPAASSFLLGKGGIISQAMSSLASGDLSCMMRTAACILYNRTL